MQQRTREPTEHSQLPALYSIRPVPSQLPRQRLSWRNCGGCAKRANRNEVHAVHEVHAIHEVHAVGRREVYEGR